MKKRNLFLSTLIPVVALVTTSCDSNKQLSYTEALQYISDHYDQNSLDAVLVDYTVEVEKFGFDLNVNIIDDIGEMSDIKFAMGLGGITTVARGFYAYCMSSQLVNKVQNAYATVSSLVMESYTKIPVEVNYKLVGGGMQVSFGTNSDAAVNILVDVIKLGVSALNALGALPREMRESILGGKSVVDNTPSVEPDPKLKSYANESSTLGKVKKGDSTETLLYITDLIYDGLGISIDPTSSSKDDTFTTYIGCESHGYITSGAVDVGGDVDIGLLLTTTDTFSGKHPEVAGIGGRYTITGNLGFKATVNAEFSK